MVRCLKMHGSLGRLRLAGHCNELVARRSLPHKGTTKAGRQTRTPAANAAANYAHFPIHLSQQQPPTGRTRNQRRDFKRYPARRSLAELIVLLFLFLQHSVLCSVFLMFVCVWRELTGNRNKCGKCVAFR